ncbi:MAG: hypothetical protein ABI699_11795 [Caldimonas sp.]
MVRVWAFVVASLAALCFAAWASDFLTMQGERTVYTVDCRDGAWQRNHCAGTLVAGNRYRYRALKHHHEVIFWTLGSSEPSGKFAECTVRDGRNWVCKPNGDAIRSITLQMADGVPIAGPANMTRPFRAVSKWRWLLLQRGWWADADVPAALATVAPPA